MKEFFKPVFTWFCGLFPVGVYNLSDSIDSLIMKLRFIELKHQADEIVYLHQVIEEQQTILVVLDIVKCLFMLVSLVLLFLANGEEIKANFSWCYQKIKRIFIFIKTKIKTFYSYLKFKKQK